MEKTIAKIFWGTIMKKCIGEQKLLLRQKLFFLRVRKMCLCRSAQTKYAHICADVCADVCADTLTETKNLNYLNQISEIIFAKIISDIWKNW